METLEILCKRVQDIANLNKDGFSLNRELKPITKGFISASKVTQNSFGEQGLKTCLAVLFGQSIEIFDGIGGWYNEENKKFYFDCIKVFNTLEECVKYGRENQQLAIFDANEGKVIDLKEAIVFENGFCKVSTIASMYVLESKGGKYSPQYAFTLHDIMNKGGLTYKDFSARK